MRTRQAREIRAGIRDARRRKWNSEIAGPYFFFMPGARTSLYRDAWHHTEGKMNIRPPQQKATDHEGN